MARSASSLRIATRTTDPRRTAAMRGCEELG
jgi:hypothetical protein